MDSPSKGINAIGLDAYQHDVYGNDQYHNGYAPQLDQSQMPSTSKSSATGGAMMAPMKDIKDEPVYDGGAYYDASDVRDKSLCRETAAAAPQLDEWALFDALKDLDRVGGLVLWDDDRKASAVGGDHDYCLPADGRHQELGGSGTASARSTSPAQMHHTAASAASSTTSGSSTNTPFPDGAQQSGGQSDYVPKIKPRKYRMKPDQEKANPVYRVKREKNNDAVRRSRDKAKKHQQEKEERLAFLEQEVSVGSLVLTVVYIYFQIS